MQFDFVDFGENLCINTFDRTEGDRSMKVVIFVRNVGHGFNPTTSELVNDLDSMGVMARTMLEAEQELETFREAVSAVVVRADFLNGIDAIMVLDELSRLKLTVPCLVHASTEDTHDGKQWADLVAESYRHGTFIQRTPTDWPDVALSKFLSDVAA